MGKAIDITNQRFGKLVAIRPTGQNRSRSIEWLCQCDCGQTRTETAGHLRAGDATSCGCTNIKDITGKRFGRLTALHHTNERLSESVVWLCECDCGAMTLVSSGNLSSGHTQSCGCLHRDMHTTHGKSHTPEYHVWQAMLQRCYNPKHPNYKDYGGRGILVEDERLLKFENFWDDFCPRPSDDMTIERIDNNKGYCKENCKWETMDKQAINKRTSAKYLVLNEDPIIIDDKDESEL